MGDSRLCFAAWNSQYLSLLRPLWLILVSPYACQNYRPRVPVRLASESPRHRQTGSGHPFPPLFPTGCFLQSGYLQYVLRMGNLSALPMKFIFYFRQLLIQPEPPPLQVILTTSFAVSARTRVQRCAPHIPSISFALLYPRPRSFAACHMSRIPSVHRSFRSEGNGTSFSSSTPNALGPLFLIRPYIPESGFSFPMQSVQIRIRSSVSWSRNMESLLSSAYSPSGRYDIQ